MSTKDVKNAHIRAGGFLLLPCWMVIHNQEKRIIFKYRNTDSFYFYLVVTRETSDGTVQKKNCEIFKTWALLFHLFGSVIKKTQKCLFSFNVEQECCNLTNSPETVGV